MTQQMDPIMEGLRLATLFSLPAYKSGSCGDDETKTREQNIILMVKFLLSGSNEYKERLLKLLGTFKTLTPHLVANSKYSGEPPFHIRNVEIYCLGLERYEQNFFGLEVSGVRYPWVLDELKNMGMIPEMVDEMRERAPKPFMPFHTWHTFLTGFISAGEKDSARGVTDCMVRQGTVIEADGSGRLLAQTIMLDAGTKGLSYKSVQIEAKFEQSYFGCIPKKDDKVAIHQGFAFRLLNDDEYSALAKTNSQVLETFKKFE